MGERFAHIGIKDPLVRELGARVIVALNRNSRQTRMALERATLQRLYGEDESPELESEWL
jgi:hypothetical protein